MNFDEIRKLAQAEWAEFSRPDRPRVLVGAATCGRAAGALEVVSAFREELAGKSLTDSVILTEVGCLGLCYAEVLVEIRGEDGRRVLYHEVTPETVPELVEAHLHNGKAVVKRALAVMAGNPLNGVPRFDELPVIKPQVRIVLRNCGVIAPDNIDHYLARQGYLGIERAFGLKPEEVIAEISASGLRGRGGAGFPTGTKWGFARKSNSETKYLICNADEGDPGAFMDRSVLEGDPHAMLEGMMIAAYAIGAATGYIYARAEYPLAIERLQGALVQMKEKGLLGRNILGSGFDFDISIKKGAGAFVCGEETALMASIEGQRGMPMPRPPFPAQAGLFGQPTNINNVETLAAVSAIMEKGADWYAQYGTEKSRGTKTFALAGKIKRTGLIEVPLGISLGTIVFDIGGGIPDDKKFKAVQTGGPSGGCIPAACLDLPVDYENLAAAGSIMGSGGMIVMDEDACMVEVTRYFLSFTENESCGKCTPCRMGTQHLRRILEDITAGRGEPEMIAKLRLICDTMKKGSLCGLGQTAPNPVLSVLRYFPEEFTAHIQDKRCPAVVCTEMFKSPCQHGCPVGMDVPAYVALVRARRLDDAYKVLKRTNPFPSICGRICDHACQSKCRRIQIDESLAIKNLKRFITDHGTPPEVEPVPVSRREEIAVIGAGPSGLTAGWALRQRGYAVTVFEERSEAGGMLRWGVPAYRLPREILGREIRDILAADVELRLNCRVGRDISFEEIGRSFDYTYVAAGAQAGAALGVPGEDAEGVYDAIAFLGAINAGQDVCVGKKVAVIGGGNSAVDAARSALRLDVESVTIYYRREQRDMPALKTEIEAAKEEGVEMEFMVTPARVIAAGGKVTGLELTRMKPGPIDRSARKRPVPIEGSEFTVAVDTIIPAIGQVAQLEFLSGIAGIEIERSRIKVEGLRTGNAKVWAGGDVVTGPAMAIGAIRAGVDAAVAIDAAIRESNGEGPWVPPPEEKIEIPFEIDEGTAEKPQAAMPEAGVAPRAGDFREVELGYSREQALAEARRCLRCDYRRE